jgi:hypothetical protein
MLPRGAPSATLKRIRCWPTAGRGPRHQTGEDGDHDDPDGGKPVETAELAQRLRPVLARLSLVLRREQHARLSLSLAQSTVLGQLLDGRTRRRGELAATECR